MCNRPFPSSKKSHFQSKAKCEAIDMKMIFNYYANISHFHNKGFALSLVLKVRFFGTWKWPIDISFNVRNIAQNVVFSFVKLLGFIIPLGTERPDTVLGGGPCNWSISTGAQKLGTGLQCMDGWFMTHTIL